MPSDKDLAPNSNAMESDSQENRRFGESLFRNATNSERQQIGFEMYQSVFQQEIRQILEQYELAERLIKAGQTGKKLRILQLNCGEGLYLHELARMLEKANLLHAVELYGISEDPDQISTAEEYSKISRPPRPYLNFYLHNFRHPLQRCAGLREGAGRTGVASFDFIFSAVPILIISHNAQTVLKELYLNGLKPGGLLCFIESSITENAATPSGVADWVLPHPAMAPVLQAFIKGIRSYNPGVAVESAVVEWLEALGATQILHYMVSIPLGGSTKQGRAALRNAIELFRISNPVLLKTGLISQAEYAEFERTIRTELTIKAEGSHPYLITMAKKPVTAT